MIWESRVKEVQNNVTIGELHIGAPHLGGKNMFAQFLIYIGLFVLFCWVGWKLFGKKLAESLTESKTLEEQRDALHRKIEALKIHKQNLEAVKQEIEVTGELTKAQRELNKAMEKLTTLDKALEAVIEKSEKEVEPES